MRSADRVAAAASSTASSSESCSPRPTNAPLGSVTSTSRPGAVAPDDRWFASGSGPVSRWPGVRRAEVLVCRLEQPVQRFCRDRTWRFCFLGGIAVPRWGEPRQTRDINLNLTLLAAFGSERPFVLERLASFAARVPDTAAFAERNRVLLLRSSSGVGIDVALGALDFEERAVARSSDWWIDDELALRTCSGEDLVVYKVFAG